MRSRLAALLGAVSLVLAFAGGLAVAQARTGSIEVTVYEVSSDGDRETLIAARVILTHVDKAIPDKAGMSNANGQVLFTDLPPGAGYVLTVSMDGYGATRVDVKVTPDQIVRIPVALQEERVETLNVVAKEAVINLDTGGTTATEIGDEYFEDLPVLGRQYTNVLQVAAGVQDADGDGNPNVHGARQRDFKMSIDNVSNVDPLTGEYQSYLNPDAIEEIEIIDSGADASFGGAVGGYGKVITKQGGNEFEGTFNFFFQDSAFDNDRAGGGEPLDFGLIQPSIYFSGPLIKNKLWFVATHQLVDVDLPILLVGGDDFVQSQKRLESMDKLTWQVSKTNKLQFQFSGDPSEIEPAAVSSIAPPETGIRYERGGPTYSVKWTAPYSPLFFYESTVAFSDIEREYNPFDPNAKNNCFNPKTPDEAAMLDLMCSDIDRGGFRSGAYFRDYKDFRQRWTYSFDATQSITEWRGGEHTFKFGGILERVHFTREMTSRDRLSLRRIGFSGGSVDPGSTNPTLETSRLTSFISTPENSSNDARGNYYAAYVSDTWEPAYNLTVSLGFRFSREELSANGWGQFDPNAEREAWNIFLDQCVEQYGLGPRQCMASALNGQSVFTVHPSDVPTGIGCSIVNNRWQCDQVNNAVINGYPINPRERDDINIVNNNIEPRVFVAWDPWNDGKTKVVASWGRFHGNTILAPIVDEADPDVTQRQSSLNSLGNIIGSAAINNVFSAYQIRYIDRDLQSQYNDEWAISVEREIAQETSIRLRYMQRKFKNQLQDIDKNHRAVTWEQALLDYPRAEDLCNRIGDYADCVGDIVRDALGNTTQVPDGIPDLEVASPYFSQVYEVGNYNESDYKAFIFELNRRYYQNWELQASYVYSKAFGSAEDYNQGIGDDPTNSDDEYGPLSYDVRHAFKLNGRVFLPIWGGFRIGTSMSWMSGLPYSIVTTQDIIDFPTNLGRGASGIDHNGSSIYTFTLASRRTTYPTGARNDQRNKPMWTVNVNFQKEFKIGKTTATAQFDIFNLLNDNTTQIFGIVRRQTAKPGGGINFVDFPIAVRRNGRVFQLAFKLNF